jgi:hypothetical protein
MLSYFWQQPHSELAWDSVAREQGLDKLARMHDLCAGEASILVTIWGEVYLMLCSAKAGGCLVPNEIKVELVLDFWIICIQEA